MLKRKVASAVLAGRRRLAWDEKDETVAVGTSPPTERQRDDELIHDPQFDRMITEDGPPSPLEKEAVPHTPTISSAVEQHQQMSDLKEAHLTNLQMQTEKVEQAQIDSFQEVKCSQCECLLKTLQDRVDAENQIMQLTQLVTRLHDQHEAELSQLEESLLLASKQIESLQAERDILQGYIARTLSKLDVKLYNVQKNTQVSSSLVEEQKAMIAECHKKLQVQCEQLTATRAQMRASAKRQQDYLRHKFELMISVQKLETDRLRNALRERVAAEQRGWSLVEEMLSLFQ